MICLKAIALISMIASFSLAQECRFAKSYSLNDVRNPTIRKKYIENVVKAEANFIKDLGVDSDTGLTIYGW